MTVHDQKHVFEWVFVLDCTSSMSPELQLILDSLGQCVERLKRMQVHLRVGLVAYQEYSETRSQFPDGIVDVVDLGPPERVQEALLKLRAQGGADRAEPTEEALRVASALGWTKPDSNGERRREGAPVQSGIMLVTDAPPHGIGDEADSWPEVKTDFFKQLDVLRAMGVPCHTLGVREFSGSKVAAGAYQLAATRTNGCLVRFENVLSNATVQEQLERLVQFFCTTILLEIQMDDILKQIGQMELHDKSPKVVNETAQSMLAERMEKLGLNGELDGGKVSYRSLGGFADKDFEDVADRKAFAQRITEKNVQSLFYCQGTALPSAASDGDDDSAYRSACAEEDDAAPSYRSLSCREDASASHKKLRVEQPVRAEENAFKKHTHKDRMKERVARCFG